MMLAISTIPKGFRVGEHYPGVYLSYTELQIMLNLLRGKKRVQIAIDLGITGRSVDYYCCNMMKLLGFDELGELIDYMRCHEALTHLY
ncbi:MAG: hypothetical protein A3F41_00450 [Coxiella sp. RIFCSPHIGHO2_12_FULL_44_14]|nr:MAG: hypothetical protein A3F41_00450 [Coxiella sp. RIFCSPHIGHO2_12_FULL_44_14]